MLVLVLIFCSFIIFSLVIFICSVSLVIENFYAKLPPLPPEPTQILMYKGFEGGGRELFLFHFAST